MDNKYFSVLTGVSAMALLTGFACGAAQAGPSANIQPAESFAELREPMRDALAVLRAADQLPAAAKTTRVQLALSDGDGSGYHYEHFRRLYHDGPVGFELGYRRGSDRPHFRRHHDRQ